MERRKLAQAALSQQVRLLDTLTEDVPGQRRSAEPEAQPLLSPPTSPVGRKRLVTGWDLSFPPGKGRECNPL